MSALLEAARPYYLYFLYSRDDQLLYVGYSGDVDERMRQHERTQEWWPEVDHRWVIAYPTLTTCIAAEAPAIHALKPPCNRYVPAGARCSTLAGRASEQDVAAVAMVVEVDALRARTRAAERECDELRETNERLRRRAAELEWVENARLGVRRTVRRLIRDVQMARWRGSGTEADWSVEIQEAAQRATAQLHDLLRDARS